MAARHCRTKPDSIVTSTAFSALGQTRRADLPLKVRAHNTTIGLLGEIMNLFQSARGLSRTLLRLSAVLLVASTSACISPSFYVDRSLGDVPPSQVRKSVNPQPVQLMYDFQTKGASNTRAADFTRATVLSTVQASNLFSSVSTDPVTGGAILSISINNVSLTDDAASKGFMTGLTLGAAGTMVTDGYVCTVDYVSGPNAAKVTTVTKHALHTVIGNTDAPQNADKATNAGEAVQTIVRQLVSRGVNDLPASGLR